MNAFNAILGLIPARFASTRFPGKPLADIGGKPMIQRVYEQAVKVLPTVYVATDDHRILTTVRSFGGKAVMTSENIGPDYQVPVTVESYQNQKVVIPLT